MEAFRDQQAGVEHVTSLNFRAGLTATPQHDLTSQMIHTNIGDQPAVGSAQMRSAESDSMLGEYRCLVC